MVDSALGENEKLRIVARSSKLVIKIGRDGRGTLTGCIIWVPKNKIYHIVLSQIVPSQKAA